MSDKSNLRAVRSKPYQPVKQPEPPAEDGPPWDPGPHRIPLRAGHADTELHFVTEDGNVVARVMLSELRYGNSNDTQATFMGVAYWQRAQIPYNPNPFANYTPPEEDDDAVPDAICLTCGAVGGAHTFECNSVAYCGGCLSGTSAHASGCPYGPS